MMIGSSISNRLSVTGTAELNSSPARKVEEPSPEPPHSTKLKPSSQLTRWSRARSIRSGRKLDRRSPTFELDSPDKEPESSLPVDGGDFPEEGGKSIYMVSDGTGWTAEHTVTAALGQFDYCLVDRGCPVSTHLFSGDCQGCYA